MELRGQHKPEASAALGRLSYHPRLPPKRKRQKTGWQEGRGRARAGTSFRLKVGDAVHDHVVQKQGLVVHFDGAGEQAAEVMHISDAGGRQL
jgi:hypothetical protein